MLSPLHSLPHALAFLGKQARCRVAMRWALAWFVLSLGIAVASPIVHPKVVEWVCSSVGSVTAIVHTDAGIEEAGAVHADCPLCVLTGPPAQPPTLVLPALLPLSRAVQSIPAAWIAAATAAPLPARGPPLRA